MSARRAIVSAAVWAGVVLVGSALVWVVISRVGDGLVRQPSATTPVQAPAGTGSGTGRGPGDGAQPPGSSSPSSPSSPGATQTDPPGPEVVSDTWSGEPGTVRVSCRGREMTDWSASPDVGWYLESEDEGEGVKAGFEQEGQGREVEVEASCTEAGPDFQVVEEG